MSAPDYRLLSALVVRAASESRDGSFVENLHAGIVRELERSYRAGCSKSVRAAIAGCAVSLAAGFVIGALAHQIDADLSLWIGGAALAVSLAVAGLIALR